MSSFRDRFVFLGSCLAFIMLIFVWLVKYEEPLLENKKLQQIPSINIERIELVESSMQNQQEINTNTESEPPINATTPKIPTENIEKNDVEFEFMNIKDEKQSKALTPSPIVELPDHWINPCHQHISEDFKFCDESLSFKMRSKDFVSHLNQTELFWLTNAWSHEIKRDNLLVPFHDWWSEALHGLSVSSGVHYWPYIAFATQFPQVIGLATSFNKQLWYDVANVISTEARVYYNYNQSYLTFWSPNINIFRDPLWGRGQEVPSECPFVSGVYAMQFVRGMQGNDDNLLKTSACCKHFIGYSYESTRTSFDSIINEYDLNDTYLVPFQYCADPNYGNASCLMCAYNQMNGVPSCLNEDLTNIVRKKWNFNGYIVTDCYALQWIYNSQLNIKISSVEIIKKTLEVGVDLNCGNFLNKYGEELLSRMDEESKKDMVDIEVLLRQSASRLHNVYFRLGMFDKHNPWQHLNLEHVNSAAHQTIAYRADQQALILLKNRNNFLPIVNAADKYQNIALIGPNAKPVWQTMGNYLGRAPFWINCYDAFKTFTDMNDITFMYEKGCRIRNHTDDGAANALSIALQSDLIVFVVGLNKNMESERLDRNTLYLTIYQRTLLDHILSDERITQPIIFIVISGGCVDVSKYHNNDKITAIIAAGYGGMFQGKAIASMIFHNNSETDFSPTGLTTQTWYKEGFIQTVDIENFTMTSDKENNYPGRGYRYYTGNDLLYPFGYGLYYTNFSCAIESINGQFVSVSVSNIGKLNSGVVILLYYEPLIEHPKNLIKRLVAFERIDMLNSEEETAVNMKMYKQFYYSDEYVVDYTNKHGQFKLEGGCLQKY